MINILQRLVNMQGYIADIESLTDCVGWKITPLEAIQQIREVVAQATKEAITAEQYGQALEDRKRAS
jgi:hypothetical protein